MLSAHFFVQACASFLVVVVRISAISVRGVPLEDKLLAAGVGLVQTALFLGLFWLGHAVVEWVGFEALGTARVVYWSFAGISAVFMGLQIPPMVRHIWRQITIPGALESDIRKRRMGLDPESD